MPDPLMPAFRRFPRDLWPMPANDEPPSALRPFVLRGATIGGASNAEVVEAKHRTPKTRVPDTRQTTSDGKDGPKSVPDTTYTPDE